MIYRIGDRAPSIDSTVFVAQSADVIGQVTLKEHSSVWFNAVIRGDCDHIEVVHEAIFRMALCSIAIQVNR